MEDIMEIIHITRKGEMMNTLESFHIYNENKLDYHINDMCTIKSNVIFKTIIQRNTSSGHSRAVIPYTFLGLVQSQDATQYASLPIHRKKLQAVIFAYTDSQFISSLQTELNN
jgi:3-methyladenine DNA glycosylase AlkC